MTGPTDNPCGSVGRKYATPYLVVCPPASWSTKAASQSIGSACACKSNSSWPKMQIDQFIQSQSVNRHTLACKQADKWCGSNVASRAKIIPNPLRRRRHRLRPSAPAQKILINPSVCRFVGGRSVSHSFLKLQGCYTSNARSSPDMVCLPEWGNFCHTLAGTLVINQTEKWSKFK